MFSFQLLLWMTAFSQTYIHKYIYIIYIYIYIYIYIAEHPVMLEKKQSPAIKIEN